MKVHTFFHAIGIIGCILGIYTLHNAGMSAWQWPVVSMVWILASYVSTHSNYKQRQLIDELDKERTHLIEQNIKLEGRVWQTELELAKAAAHNQLEGK